MKNTATTSAHAPAPWILEESQSGVCNWVIRLDNWAYVAVVGDGAHEGGPDMAAANARLIAAAPDLLEASRQLYDALIEEIGETPDSELSERTLGAMNDMKAAWDKVKGTTPEKEHGKAA